jgi:hypothetical protein
MILRGHSRDRKSLCSSLNFCRSCTKVHSPSIDRPLRQKELIEYQRTVDLVHLGTLAMANVRWIWSKPETGKKIKIPPTPQARKVSRHSNISQYETERKARKLLWTTKPETGPLHSRTPKELPEIVSADEKKSRYNTNITELTNETKTTGRQTCSLPKKREETTTKYSTPASMPTVSSPQKPLQTSRKKKKKANH